MSTMIGALFVISMLVLVGCFLYFILKGTSVAASNMKDAAAEARAEAHVPEPGATITPPATGLLMKEVPSETKSPSPG
jgi:flagellar basal body-associated protein FliL